MDNRRGEIELPLTEPQLKAIYGVGLRARNWSEDEINMACARKYQCRPSALSRVQATFFIDWLKDATRTE